MEPKKNITYQRIQIFDSLRGLSIFFIIIYHYILDFSHFQIRPGVGDLSKNISSILIFSPNSPQAFIANIFTAIFSIGWQFVEVFLLLSGFGLTYSRLIKGEQNYFFKRLLRIFPYWQYAIIFAFLINSFSHTLQLSVISPTTLELKNYLLLFLFPFYIDSNFSLIAQVNPSLWFIILLFQFYIVFDVLFYLIMKWRIKKFFIASLLITLLYRFLIIYFFNQQPGAIFQYEGRMSDMFNLLPARLFEFACGMILGTLLFHKKISFSKILTWKSFFMGLTIWFVGNISTWNVFGWIFSDILITIGLLLLSTFCLHKIQNKTIIQSLTRMGNISYEVYLFHNQPVTQILVPATLLLINKYANSELFFLTAIFCLSLLLFFASSLKNKTVG
jgi:peptidoglycan/LPS O-acetylase OafA/YrhL